MQIRTLEPHEVDLHREVRLRALADAPDAFGVVVSEVEAQPMSYWEELTRSVTEPGRHVMFLACEGETVLGSTYGLLDRAQREAGRVGGMWVAPAARRQGIGRALLHAVMAWARGHQPIALRRWRYTGRRGFGRPDGGDRCRIIRHWKLLKWCVSCDETPGEPASFPTEVKEVVTLLGKSSLHRAASDVTRDGVQAGVPGAMEPNTMRARAS
jgi:GNAT superfamily N-acetyltransferase